MKIFIGIPCNRQIKPKTVESLMELQRKHEFKTIVATEGYTIAENRIYLVAQAKKWGADYILFVDDDMVFPSDTLEKLLSHRKEIIGVNSHSRMLPLKTTIELYDEGIPDDVFECKAIGGGVLLVKMEVFEKIDKPFFAFETYNFGMIKMGEDAWFCRQAKNKGYKIWCDPKIEVKHLGDYLY